MNKIVFNSAIYRPAALKPTGAHE